MTAMELVDQAMAEDRELYASAGLLDTVTCYTCRITLEVHDPRIRRVRLPGRYFCSERCRLDWRKLAAAFAD